MYISGERGKDVQDGIRAGEGEEEGTGIGAGRVCGIGRWESHRICATIKADCAQSPQLNLHWEHGGDRVGSPWKAPQTERKGTDNDVPVTEGKTDQFPSDEI